MSTSDIVLRDTSKVPHDVRIALVASQFNARYVEKLVQINVDFLRAQELANIDLFQVPGALEIPAMVAKIKHLYDAVICLGVVIRWATSHYEIVSEQSARSLMDISQEYAGVLINGILTCENETQVQERIRPVYAISALNLLAELSRVWIPTRSNL